MASTDSLRSTIRDGHIAPELHTLKSLVASSGLTDKERARTKEKAELLIRLLRSDDDPGLMEVFLAEYGLSTDEGVALMCLAEALLRVPDADTMDELIEDKIAPSSWGEHLGKSSSSLVNASTWALLFTGKVLDDQPESGMAALLHGALRRLGEPVIRAAVKRAMEEMGNQFVLGETIDHAIARGLVMQQRGYTYSYDMLGEAALTEQHAKGYFSAYQQSIEALSAHCHSEDSRENPGISIKLSALHPRYELLKKDRVMTELVDSVLQLVLQARNANMGLNIDAEESDRLDLSLSVIDKVLSDDRLSGWDGFGVVVQAYGKRAAPVINWLYQLAIKLDRNLMVRLVKGAYWDTEIKRSQTEGLEDFPVYTRKSGTDVSYLCCAKQLLSKTDRLYPQFATHNAHTIAGILTLTDDGQPFEFQRLHGMGEALHEKVKSQYKSRCRIYAPVGAHRDLLAYLVRRLLENGANSSFVNQIVDADVPIAAIAADPFDAVDDEYRSPPVYLRWPGDLYLPDRTNSKGWDLHSETDLQNIERGRDQFRKTCWAVEPILASNFNAKNQRAVYNPANADDQVATIAEANSGDVTQSIADAASWADSSSSERAEILNTAADLFEEHSTEIFAILAREAGKTLNDAVAELREAVDFLRFYAAEAQALKNREARGVFVCISPWNFPLAIFTGQIAAALSAGNGVLAKPAESTPIIATVAVKLLHKAGVPEQVLQLLIGDGSTVGNQLVNNPHLQGVCFTGSTITAQRINRAMAENGPPDAPLIAETGGINAMIVDSTALPEQAVKDIVASAFQSTGQRCSALRVLYLQQDIYEPFMDMLIGATTELAVGNPWELTTDVGPIINTTAKEEIVEYVESAARDGELIYQSSAVASGNFLGPIILRTSGISALTREVFGPVLHVATFASDELNDVVSDVNASGYGLTFGLHTRIDDRVESLSQTLQVGNLYVNRNQIGAVVGTQPFGGEGLSGTGPKAGGPNYVKRFTQSVEKPSSGLSPEQATPEISQESIQRMLDSVVKSTYKKLSSIACPGPTGESNRLLFYPRGTILCLGPTADQADAQAAIAISAGCTPLCAHPGAQGEFSVDGFLPRQLLTSLENLDGVALWSDTTDLRLARKALAARSKVIIPLMCSQDMKDACILERHICVDTTASGGNASLLSQSTHNPV